MLYVMGKVYIYEIELENIEIELDIYLIEVDGKCSEKMTKTMKK